MSAPGRTETVAKKRNERRLNVALELPGFRGHYRSLVPIEGSDRCILRSHLSVFSSKKSEVKQLGNYDVLRLM
jgi:hypothetical protein